MIDFKEKKYRNLLIYVAIAITILVLLIAISSKVIKNNKKKVVENNRTETVMTIGDRKVSKDEFVCLCREVIENGEIDGRFLLSKTNKSIASEVYAMVTEDLISQTYILNLAEEAGVALTEREKILTELEVKEKGDNEFYMENYCVTLEKYIKIAQNKALCEKYLEYVKNNINYSDELLRETYYKNKYKLLGGTINVVYIDKETLGENSVGLDISYDEYAKQKADIAFRDISENTMNFIKYTRYYGLTDYSLGSLECQVNSDMPEKYKGILTQTIDGEIGKVYMVETKTGYAIFEIVSKLKFDDIKNDAKIRQIIENNTISDIYENAPKYLTALTSDAYNDVNITEYIQERRNTL